MGMLQDFGGTRGYISMQPFGQLVLIEQPKVQSKYCVSPQASTSYVLMTTGPPSLPLALTVPHASAQDVVVLSKFFSR
jgi:hypothetical protein